MNPQKTHIEISLAEIAPDLLVSMGERRYLLWAKEFATEIRSSLAAMDERVATTVDTKALRGASTKSAHTVLAIGTIGITLAGYLGAPEKATKIAQIVWKALKTAFQKTSNKSSFKLRIETTTSRQTVKKIVVVDVAAPDPEGALRLLSPLMSQGSDSPKLQIIFEKE
jgi:hypothetical protein